MEKIWANPIKILLLIRDGKAHDWDSLCRLCGCDPMGTASFELSGHVVSLIHAGLISTEESVKKSVDISRFRQVKGKIKVTDKVRQLQNTLRISLKEISKLNQYSSMIVNPRFEKPSEKFQPIDIFVLMPFSESFNPVYEDHIKSVAKKLSLSVNRADDFFTDKSIILDIWNAINHAKFIIADCSTRNPNVFYEMGIAHVIGKPVILIAQKEEDVPFDIGHLRYIKYNYTPRGMQEFEKNLKSALKKLTDHEYK